MVLPKELPFIATLLREYHDGAVGGHAGTLKTYRQLATDWFWDRMKRMIASYMLACPVCQLNKTSTLSLEGLLQPLPVPDQVWDDIIMDFVVGLPLSQGFNSILVVVDHLSKYAHFLALRHPF